MDSIMTHLQAALSMGEEIVDRNPNFCQTKYMRKLEVHYGGSRASWFLGFFSVASFALYLLGGLALITNLIGFCYPAVASFRAIDSPEALASQQWLSYWAIFGAFCTAEIALPFVITTYYPLFKLVVLVYLFHPFTRGATVVYGGAIRPFFARYALPGSASARKVAPGSTSARKTDPASAMPAFVAPISRGAPAPVADLVDSALSELRVVVVSASDVVPTEAPGAGVDCDPYCVLEVLPRGVRSKHGAAENTKYKTVCKTGTANPVWNEGVTIPQVEPVDTKLVVTVCNKRAMGRDQRLGKIEVPLYKMKGLLEPADMVVSLDPADETSGPAFGDLRVTIQIN